MIQRLSLELFFELRDSHPKSAAVGKFVVPNQPDSSVTISKAGVAFDIRQFDGLDAGPFTAKLGCEQELFELGLVLIILLRTDPDCSAGVFGKLHFDFWFGFALTFHFTVRLILGV